ncbi:MAG TPA: hypothetical protein VJP45_08750, partial [Candidatus Limnocylindria bacterium]|nr:hypothetical protein [Candidatus Limnocylindria bacterium]
DADAVHSKSVVELEVDRDDYREAAHDFADEIGGLRADLAEARRALQETAQAWDAALEAGMALEAERDEARETSAQHEADCAAAEELVHQLECERDAARADAEQARTQLSEANVRVKNLVDAVDTLERLVGMDAADYHDTPEKALQRLLTEAEERGAAKALEELQRWHAAHDDASWRRVQGEIEIRVANLRRPPTTDTPDA